MSKIQDEINRLHRIQKENFLFFNPPVCSPEALTLMGVFFGSKLTKADIKRIRIMLAEWAEYQVWHQQP